MVGSEVRLVVPRRFRIPANERRRKARRYAMECGFGYLTGYQLRLVLGSLPEHGVSHMSAEERRVLREVRRRLL